LQAPEDRATARPILIAGNDALEAADLENAAGLVLAADDDGGNMSLALRAQRLNPGLAIVVRLFDATLVRYVTETLAGVRVMSMCLGVRPQSPP
jgi:voltage-gated potassium channel Kch